MRKIKSLIVFAALIGGSGPTYAHHSYAMFDTGKVVTVRGSLKTLEWTNPHVWLWLDVEDKETKKILTYGFESLSPAQLMRDYEWDKRLFKAGAPLTVEYAPLKSGNRGGALIKVTLSDGRVLGTRFSAPREVAPIPGAQSK